MLFGAVALSEHFRTDILERARMARAMISQELYDALLDADALILPTVSSHAYVAGKNTNQFFDAHTKDDLLCALASLSGLPAVSLPFAEPDALPLGIQLIGKKFADVELLCMAAALFERSEDEIR
jgi:Asp-tRNA(Asn)/Glu-tRNA(Gln) amidotransferase A subunit family amidase